jgi:hypothetical protein
VLGYLAVTNYPFIGWRKGQLCDPRNLNVRRLIGRPLRVRARALRGELRHRGSSIRTARTAAIPIIWPVAQTPFLGVCDLPKESLQAFLRELEEYPADEEPP